VLPSEGEEIKTVGNWLAESARSGLLPHEFGIFARSSAQLDRARSAAAKAGIPFKVLDERVDTTSNHLSISTMHLAKGLEFRAVAEMACDDEIIPLQERIETVGDDAVCKMSTIPSDIFSSIVCRSRNSSIPWNDDRHSSSSSGATACWCAKPQAGP
jgi:superfamily I DNA/RNA helicase